MKRISAFTLSFLLLGSIVIAGTPASFDIGSTLPETDAAFKDVTGKDVMLQDVAGENGLLVIFTCNTCPYVLAWQDRYPDIADYCRANDIGLVMLNPNEARRSTSDSYEAMQAHAKEHDFDFYYALDENHQLADALGATKTPDVFLFDSDMTLVYKGAIDDNHKDASAVKEKYLANALDNLLNGSEIDPAVTKAIGCSIKRVQ